MAPEDLLRLLLLLTVIGMATLALFYLRQRRMPPIDALAWVLLAVLFPILGPILVIALRPGQPAVRNASLLYRAAPGQRSRKIEKRPS